MCVHCQRAFSVCIKINLYKAKIAHTFYVNVHRIIAGFGTYGMVPISAIFIAEICEPRLRQVPPFKLYMCWQINNFIAHNNLFQRFVGRSYLPHAFYWSIYSQYDYLSFLYIFMERTIRLINLFFIRHFCLAIFFHGGFKVGYPCPLPSYFLCPCLWLRKHPIFLQNMEKL